MNANPKGLPLLRERQTKSIAPNQGSRSNERFREKQPPRPYNTGTRYLVEYYRIESASSPQNLVTQVQGALAEGLQPYGPPCVVGIELHQCLVRWAKV